MLVDIGSSTNPFPNAAHSAGYSVTVVDYTKIIFGVGIWSKIRQKRKSKYQGLSMFVFKKIEEVISEINDTCNENC